MSDIEIVSKCIDWDLSYFWALYERYIDKIYKFVYYKIFNTEVTEDLVSEVFVSVLDKIDTFQVNENANFSAWLYKIANNKVIDFYRTNKENESLENSFEIWENLDFGRDIDNKDKLNKIYEYLKTMKQEHRQVFLYRIWEELSYKEIVNITWLTEGNCKQIVSRTLKNILANFGCILVFIWIIF